MLGQGCVKLDSGPTLSVTLSPTFVEERAESDKVEDQSEGQSVAWQPSLMHS